MNPITDINVADMRIIFKIFSNNSSLVWNKSIYILNANISIIKKIIGIINLLSGLIIIEYKYIIISNIIIYLLIWGTFFSFMYLKISIINSVPIIYL